MSPFYFALKEGPGVRIILVPCRRTKPLHNHLLGELAALVHLLDVVAVFLRVGDIDAVAVELLLLLVEAVAKLGK